jgi:hypothetical protein
LLQIKDFFSKITNSLPVQMPDPNPIEGMWNTQQGNDKILKIKKNHTMNNSMIRHVFKGAFPRSSYNLHIQGGATKTSERSIKTRP